MNDQAPSEGGPLSPDQIIQLLRFAIRDSKNHGRGAPVVSFGLHVAESIIHALRAEKRAEVSAAVRSHDILVAENAKLAADFRTALIGAGELTVERAALVAALEQYGAHDSECDQHHFTPRPVAGHPQPVLTRDPCSCGLDAALKAAKGAA